MFFDELYALGQFSEDELNTDGMQHIPTIRTSQDSSSIAGDVLGATSTSDCGSRIPSVRRASQPIPTSHNASPVLAENSLPPLQRQTLITTNTILSTDNRSVGKEITSVNKQLRQIRAPHRTASAPTSSTIPTVGDMEKSSLGKRKRKDVPLKYVPEAQQIFLGCNFFFIPNDEVAPMRRARIRKAREYGAKWVSIWGSDITHIIVDKSLSYEDIISFLKIPSIPTAMIMVNDTYPIDCVQFKAILNPQQRQYRVKGHQHALEGKARQESSSQTTNIQLQLKAVQSWTGKWDYVAQRGTPPRSESSTQTFLRTLPAQVQPDVNFNNATIETPNIETDGGMREDEFKPMEQYSPSLLHMTSNVEGRDALDEMIREARTFTHLPLDEDDFDRPPSRDETPEKDGTSDESVSNSSSKPRASVAKGSNKGAFDQKNFSCMKGGNRTTDTLNPNSRTISILQEMADYYTRINDTWRPIAYRKAISTLRQQPNKITTSEEAFKLPCIGQRLALKIEEIVTTDRLRRLENAKTEPGDHILQIFMGIYGVGFSQANKWLHSGYSTLEDLKKHAHLTDNQLLGIEHYADFQTRIPREEVTALGDIVKATANEIDPNIEIIIGGSYRRGAATSGDIDCIITKPNTSSSNDIFAFLVELTSGLASCNFLVAALATPRAESGTKWHGCCVLPGTAKPIWRRIDFLLVPASEIGAALIYFTGNDIFNRSIRLLASRKGMRLNQRGLYKDVMRGPGRAKLNEGELVEGADEKKIFAVLGVPWRPPEQRIC
jgi:DNA polymerase IV